MNYSYLEKAPVEDTTKYETLLTPPSSSEFNQTIQLSASLFSKTKYQWICRCNIERSYIDPKTLMKRKPIFPSVCMKCGYKREIFEILIPIDE